MNKNACLLVAMFVLLLVAAMSVVYSKHLNRKYFSELHRLTQVRDAMNIEWGQLQLERSTFATSSEVEKSARRKLNMEQPTNKKIISINHE
ncbi:MAG TPA: cell division protein FtsL [Gammaproteobacteria bacterium]|nr:cell division protein FtsL [Gammaproteobacteria bacterium]